jgi:hypothetical protein
VRARRLYLRDEPAARPASTLTGRKHCNDDSDSPTAPVTGTGTGAGAVAGTIAIVPLAGKAVQVACGWHHACAVLDDGSLWSCGLNDHGQCGTGQLGPSSKDLISGHMAATMSRGQGPRGAGLQIPLPSQCISGSLGGVRVTEVACSGYSCWARDEAGEVHACGAVRSLDRASGTWKPLKAVAGVVLSSSFAPVPAMRGRRLVSSGAAETVVGMPADSV